MIDGLVPSMSAKWLAQSEAKLCNDATATHPARLALALALGLGALCLRICICNHWKSVGMKS